MGIMRWVKSREKRYWRSRKGISTIMANLMMLIIVVFLASILFVWAMSSFSAYQGGAGYWFSSKSLANQERLSIENVYFSGTPSLSNHNQVTVYYRNVGAVPVTVASIYMTASGFSFSQNLVQTQLNINSVTSQPLLLGSSTWQSGTLYTIKLATLRGTTVTTTWVA